MDKLVSIVMPSFNMASYIAESIRSVLNQTYTNWELIIVDDCSTDNTAEIVSSFNDSRIRYFKNEKNSGAAISRNLAFREARGEYVAFLDSDDLWREDKLEKQIHFMESNNYSFTYTNYERIDDNGNRIGVFCTGPKIVTKTKMYRYCYLGCLTVMYKRKDFLDLQISDIKKNNDYAIWLRICKTFDCYLLEENLGYYRVRKKSISHDKLLKKIKSHYDLFRICEGCSSIVSFWFACLNIWFGFWKKIIYEKAIVE